MRKPDKLLEADVRDELDWDPALDDTRITVEAHEGKVTLQGVVATLSDAQRAVEDTRQVGGVKEVESKLRVGPEGGAIEDSRLAVECEKVLEADRLLPVGAISVTVKDGQVTLRGEVRHHYQRDAAERDVSSVAGVLLVDDELVLTDAPIPSDVAERIERALKRSAVNADSDIKVSRDGRQIILDGTVTSMTALDMALDTAWSAPGVNKVVNHLRLED